MGIARLLMIALFGLCITVGVTGLTGCEEKGPMEKAGESLDDAAKDAGDALEDAGDEIEDAVEGN